MQRPGVEMISTVFNEMFHTKDARYPVYKSYNL